MSNERDETTAESETDVQPVAGAAPEPAPLDITEAPPSTREPFSSDGAHHQPGWNRPDPRQRPHDPAGSYPRFSPADLLPSNSEPLIPPSPIVPAPTMALPHLTPGGVMAAEMDTSALPEPPQAARFQFVTGALIALAAAGVLLFALVAANKDDTRTETIVVGPSWSTWAPHAGAQDGATQIAEHIGHQYKAQDGRQLVAVTGGPLEVAGLPLTIALRASAAQGGDISLVEGKGVLYRLCGLGEKCSIPSGKPSVERHLLLRREALELALYSFRYLKDVNEVVVFLPPRKGQDPSQALFFRPKDVAAELNRPLSSTLSPRTPGVGTVKTSQNADLVDSITTESLFQFSLTQANQDSRAFLVLDRFADPAP